MSRPVLSSRQTPNQNHPQTQTAIHNPKVANNQRTPPTYPFHSDTIVKEQNRSSQVPASFYGAANPLGPVAGLLVEAEELRSYTAAPQVVFQPSAAVRRPSMRWAGAGQPPIGMPPTPGQTPAKSWAEPRRHREKPEAPGAARRRSSAPPSPRQSCAATPRQPGKAPG